MSKKNKAYEFNGKEYKINAPLSIKEKGLLVRSIADGVFNDGVYAPYMFNIAYILNCVVYYTDIVLPQRTTEEGETYTDIDLAYELIKKSDVMATLEKYISNDIYASAREIIEYRKKAFLLNKGINEITESIKSLKNKEIEELTSSISTLVNNLDKTVEAGIEDFDVGEVMNMARTIAEKDESELAKGILEYQENEKS